MRYAIQKFEIGDCVPEAIDVETTQVIERSDELDDDEPPPLPPPPARGSSTFAAVSDDDGHTTSRYVAEPERTPLGPSFTRLIVPRKRLGSCGPEDHAARRAKSDTLVDDELLYQALLRQLRS